jgi:hypothetical protein
VSAKKTKPSKQPKPGQMFGQRGVQYTFPQGEGGPIQILVNFALAPEPLQYYYADSVHLVVDDELRMVALSCGRRDPNSDNFADRIDIIMPTNALFAQFWSTSREVESTVDKILKSLGVTLKARSMSSPESSAAPTFFANMIFVAVGEGESILDFYQLSPREVHFAKAQKMDMKLQPVIRVFISTVLIKHFFNLLRPHSQEQTVVPVLQGGELRAAGRSR